MNVTAAGLLIWGFGGHARSITDVALSAGIRNFVFIEPNARDGEQFLGFPVVKSWDNGLPDGWQCFAAAGDNWKRPPQVEEIAFRGWPLAKVISPRATIGAGAIISDGCFLAHHSHVGPTANIGTSCILNTGCVVDHDSRVGAYSHISVNAVVAGGSNVGKFVFMGAGSTLIDKCSIADEVIVGAGAVVVKPISSSGLYVGVPAVRVADKI
jgi:UDP-N-acetylbacillosamine N-acetyltransferase